MKMFKNYNYNRMVMEARNTCKRMREFPSDVFNVNGQAREYKAEVENNVVLTPQQKKILIDSVMAERMVIAYKYF